jgi:glucose-6-phosphate-specific signal transduction histidine kinase
MYKNILSAITFNIILPGSGYLYIDAKNRKPLAYFLVFITLYQLFQTFIHLSNGNNELYAINVSPFFPGLIISPLGIVLVVIMSIDTYFVAKKRVVNSKAAAKKVEL